MPGNRNVWLVTWPQIFLCWDGDWCLEQWWRKIQHGANWTWPRVNWNTYSVTMTEVKEDFFSSRFLSTEKHPARLYCAVQSSLGPAFGVGKMTLAHCDEFDEPTVTWTPLWKSQLMIPHIWGFHRSWFLSICTAWGCGQSPQSSRCWCWGSLFGLLVCDLWGTRVSILSPMLFKIYMKLLWEVTTRFGVGCDQ